MHEYLREQKERVTSSKEEAEKLLTQLGTMHLFVPMKKSKSNTPGRPKKAGKVKFTGK